VFTIRVSSRPGEVHSVRVRDLQFRGSYASVWFDEPNKWTKENREVPNAPKYYIDFSWRKYLTIDEAKALLDAWLAKRGLVEHLAKWRSTYHIKYFYQAIIDRLDDKPIGKRFMEVWSEVNWDGERLNSTPFPTKGTIKVISGLPHYKVLPFRVVGVGAQHPLDFGIIVLFSSFVYQYRVWEVV